MDIGRGLASLGVCLVAAVMAYKESPGYAFITAVFGLLAIWGNV